MDNNANQQQQGGSGSAEQTGRERAEQKMPTTDLSETEQAKMASQIGEEKNKIVSVADLGGKSGRDDAAGGSGDGQDDEDTDTPTEKF